MTEQHDFEGKWFEHPVLKTAFIALLIAAITFLLTHLWKLPRSIEVSFYCLSIVIGGFHWSQEAIEKLVKRKQVGIEFLMMTATIGSAILGMWDEAAFLVVLYAAAEGLEEYTFAKTRASLRKLLELVPKEAWVRKKHEEFKIPIEKLNIDDIFIVKPGESIPTDGVIVQGNSSVNEAPVTGESIPVEKTKGAKVFAATINHDGVLEVRVTATFKNNTLSKLVHMVEEAKEQKGRTQVFIETFGKRYSPVVLLAAVLLLLVPFALGGSILDWGTRAVILLVAAAPCALMMATPIAIASGIGAAGKNGILIKGGMHLENLGKIRIIAFDKTGTLTEGRPRVTDLLSTTGNEPELLQVALSLEKSSTHPLARAIIEKAKERGITSLPVDKFKTLIGSGIEGTINDTRYYIGNVSFFQSLGVNPKHTDTIARWRAEGKTVVLLGTSDRIEGVIAIQDQIRENALEVIRELHAMGLKTAMLTGDNAFTARAIAQKIGIDDVRSDLKPEDKIKAVEELIQNYGSLAMVGDGINDAPALARASVGIAMGAAGTDAAIEAADAALMGDNLQKLIYGIRLGRKALSIGKQNIVFSILVLAVLIPSALLGAMTITVTVVVHEVSELLAVANGLRVSQ